MAARVHHPRELEPHEVVEISEKYRQFVNDFGPEDAAIILHCGAHRPDRPHLDDWFEDCIPVAIGYECISTWAEIHGFKATSEQLTEWIKTNVNLAPYDTPGEMVSTYKKAFKEFVDESVPGDTEA